MNRLFKGHFRTAVLVVVFFFASTLAASPAFSRDRWRRYPRHYYGPHHVRVFHDGDLLPALIATGIIAGITYSLIDSASNPPVHEYRVVERTYPRVAPPDPYAPVASTGSVMVTAQLLNVRTGPSLDEPSIRQIPYGTVLSIHGSSPDWYYVHLSGHQYGWVMIRFTAPLDDSGAG